MAKRILFRSVPFFNFIIICLSSKSFCNASEDRSKLQMQTNYPFESIFSSPIVSPSHYIIKSSRSSNNSNFLIAWDSRSRNPLFTLELLKANDLITNGDSNNDEKQNGKIRPPFFSESSIIEKFRVRKEESSMLPTNNIQ
jgi:hypothetical protein